MKKSLIITMILCVSMSYSQDVKTLEFQLGCSTHLFKGDSLNELLNDPSLYHGEASINYGFGINASINYRILPFLEIGLQGSLQRSSGTNELVFTYVNWNSPEDTTFFTGHSSVQLNNYSYGIQTKFILSQLLFPEWSNSETHLSGGIQRSHVFIDNTVFNPNAFKEFYTLNHLGTGWTFQFGIGYNFRFKKNDLLHSFGVELQYRQLKSTTLQNRIYGSEKPTGNDPNIAVGYSSLGIGVSFGLAR